MNELTNDIIRCIKPTLKRFDASYVFNNEMHRIARQENSIQPAVAPFFWKSIFEKSTLLSEQELCKSATFVVGKIQGVSPDMVLQSRIRQFWTGFLRELDFMIRLKEADPDGIVAKDIDMDLGDGGCDVLYTRSHDQYKMCFAVMMDGIHGGYESREKRKNKKKEGWNIIHIIVDKPPDDSLAKVHETYVKVYCFQSSPFKGVSIRASR